MSMIFATRTSLLVLIIIAVLTVETHVRAEEPRRQIWLISSRSAAFSDQDGSSSSAAHLRYWRLQDDSSWADANAKQYRAEEDAKIPTIVFIHGNRTTADEAVTTGFHAYHAICAQADGRPFRFVIWSWPSDRFIRKLRLDALRKAVYSESESRRLAHWINESRPDTKISLVGHSFGPRIIVGALHLLAGGEVEGYKMPEKTVAKWTVGRHNPVRIVLLAAALDAGVMAPDASRGLAMTLVDRAMITVNRCDRALRFYPWLQGHRGPQAVGRLGPFGVESEKIALVNVRASVGKTHDSDRYCDDASLASYWAKYTFLDNDVK